MLALTVASSLVAADALAYEGPFCTKVPLGAGGRCPSSEVSAIRRAVGRSEGRSTEIAIINQYGESTNKCRETSCEVGTEYLNLARGTAKSSTSAWRPTTTTATSTNRSRSPNSDVCSESSRAGLRAPSATVLLGSHGGRTWFPEHSPCSSSHRGNQGRRAAWRGGSICRPRRHPGAAAIPSGRVAPHSAISSRRRPRFSSLGSSTASTSAVARTTP
jgi:hypothetical protein